MTSKVVQLVREKAARAGRQADKILLVGRFSGLPYYTAQLLQAFETDVSKVLCPPHAASAVLLGR